MYKRERATSKPASQGHPSRGGVTVGGGTKSKPVVYKSPKPKAVVRPDVTLGGNDPRKTGYSKPPKVSRSSPAISDRPYTRKEEAAARGQRQIRKQFAKNLFNPKLNSPDLNKFAREHFWTEPVKLQRNNFTAVSKEMWDHLGLAGKMPKLVYNDVAKQPGSRAYTYRGRNAIYVEPNLPTEAQSKKGAYGVFAHEAAHTRQSASQKGVEGLADAFAHTKGTQALRSMGIKAKPYASADSYKRAEKRVRRRRSRRYIAKGQFEHR